MDSSAFFLLCSGYLVCAILLSLCIGLLAVWMVVRDFRAGPSGGRPSIVQPNTSESRTDRQARKRAILRALQARGQLRSPPSMSGPMFRYHPPDEVGEASEYAPGTEVGETPESSGMPPETDT